MDKKPLDLYEHQRLMISMLTKQVNDLMSKTDYIKAAIADKVNYYKQQVINEMNNPAVAHYMIDYVVGNYRHNLETAAAAEISAEESKAKQLENNNIRNLW